MLVLNLIWGYILKIAKSKWFWFILLGLLLVFFINKNRNNRFEVERLKTNNLTLNQSIKVMKTKNGELYYSVNALTLKKDEFLESNQKLSAMLKDMNIKLKNVQSITQMGIKYEKTYDIINSTPIVITDTVFITDNTKPELVNYFSKFSFVEDSDDASISGMINIPTSLNPKTKESSINKSSSPYLSDLNIRINDTLTIVPTINYKRVWIFFRRPKSVTVFVKSENKLFNLEQMKTYQITK